MTLTDIDIEAQFQAIMFGVPDVDPADLPPWLADPDPMLPTPPKQEDYVPRHSTGRERCPWLDVEVPEPTNSLAVEVAATTAMLDLQVGFIKSPTAKHAHDGTALAMIDHAADELRAALKQRSIPRGALRSLLGKLEAMR